MILAMLPVAVLIITSVPPRGLRRSTHGGGGINGGVTAPDSLPEEPVFAERDTYRVLPGFGISETQVPFFG